MAPLLKTGDRVAHKGDPENCGRVEDFDDERREYSVYCAATKVPGHFAEELLQHCDGEEG